MLRFQTIMKKLQIPTRTATFESPKLMTSKPGENKKVESERMKKFHEQLKVENVPRIGPAMRFVDLVLVETDKKGELIPNSEKDPTKWGDWQHGGRVTDF